MQYVCTVCADHSRFFTFPLDIIGRPCSVIVILPGSYFVTILYFIERHRNTRNFPDNLYKLHKSVAMQFIQLYVLENI